MAKAHKDDGQRGGLAQSALKSNAALAALAMKGADTWQKLVVYWFYGISGLGLLVVGVPPYESAKQIVALVLIVVPLSGTAVFVVMRYRRLTGQDPAAASAMSPLPTNIKLSSATQTAMFDVLEEARNLVRDTLRQKD